MIASHDLRQPLIPKEVWGGTRRLNITYLVSGLEIRKCKEETP